MRRQQGFEVVAGAGANEIAALRSEQISDGTRVVAPDCLTGENDGAGVDVRRTKTRFKIGRVDQASKRLVVDLFRPADTV